jgi:hypothetical protein
MEGVSGECQKKPIAQVYQNEGLLGFWYAQDFSTREGEGFRSESDEPHWHRSRANGCSS